MSERTTQNTGRVGVHAVGAIFEGEFHWHFREQHESDFGIDAQVETSDENGRPSGKLIALQIKSGPSHFEARGEDYVFRGERKHLDYWTNHCLPVFVILHNPETKLTLWQKVEARFITQTPKGWSMTIPGTNTLDMTSKKYLEVGIAADSEASRRFWFATDQKWMRKFEEEGDVFFVFDVWINKTLNMRGVKVYFKDQYKSEADIDWDIWAAGSSPHDIMRSYFPWLDYEYAEPIEEGGGGEVESHTLYVRLNEHAKRFLALEDFFEVGSEDQPDPEAPLSDEDEFRRQFRDASYQDYLQDEMQRHQEETDGPKPEVE